MKKHKAGKNLFFLGKGGTGKTTIAALTATALSEKGHKVVLISMDPAHNLFDIFQINSSKSTVKLNKNFIVEEIDIKFWIKTYLKSIEEKIARSYQHLTSLSLEKHIETIRYSPGLEEYALQFAYEKVLKKYEGYSYRLFDMPPTALSLRFFNLPKLTIVWLDQLIDLRKKILQKKMIINDVYQTNSEGSKDEVLNQLYDMKKVNQRLINNFQEINFSGIYVVMNEDHLSLCESSDIYDMISKNGFCIDGIIVNKSQNIMKDNEIAKKFNKLSIHFIPFVDYMLIGTTRLNEFIKNKKFSRFLDSIFNSTLL